MARSKENSSLQRERKELESEVVAPRLASVPGSHHIAVAGPKGGAGKTTTAAMLAMTLAKARGEIVVILDATNHIGTLRRRLVPPTQPRTRPFRELCQRALAGDLAPEWSALAPYSDVVGSLRVLRSVSSPLEEQDLSPAEFTAGVDLLRRAGQILISDIGSRANGPLANAALLCADSLVLSTELAYDALELAIEMASALAGQPLSYRPDPDEWSSTGDGRFVNLVVDAVVVVAPSRRLVSERDPNLSAMLEWLRVVCGGGVITVGRDNHLGEGDLIDLERLELETVFSYLRVAAAVAASFATGAR